MRNRLTVFNQKGGVGKTTTALNLGAALARRGCFPLLLDLDAQSHLTSMLCHAVTGAASVFAYFGTETALAELVRPVDLAGAPAEILPAHSELNKVDTLFGKGPGVVFRLRNGLDDLAAGAGAGRPVIIDCCPMLGVLSLSGVIAAGRVLIPISTDFLALRGAQQLDQTLLALEHLLKGRVPRRYVLTRFDGRRRMSHEILARAKEQFGAELCVTRIAESVAVAESPAHNRDIFSHAPDSRGAREYAALLDELLEGGFLELSG